MTICPIIRQIQQKKNLVIELEKTLLLLRLKNSKKEIILVFYKSLRISAYTYATASLTKCLHHVQEGRDEKIKC